MGLEGPLKVVPSDKVPFQGPVPVTAMLSDVVVVWPLQ